MDQDYIKDLSEEDKAWLSDFNEEYYGANLNFEDLEKNRFHKTEEEKKACTDRVNARNRCLYSIVKATKNMIFEEVSQTGPVADKSPSDHDSTRRHPSSDPKIENAIIEYIDSKKLKDEEV